MTSSFGGADVTGFLAVLAVGISSLFDFVAVLVKWDMAGSDLGDEVSLTSRKKISSLEKGLHGEFVVNVCEPIMAWRVFPSCLYTEVMIMTFANDLLQNLRAVLYAVPYTADSCRATGPRTCPVRVSAQSSNGFETMPETVHGRKIRLSAGII